MVIVSTVRTDSVGFIDNPNRLNVALTRGKLVVRVVGNMEFFDRIPSEKSTLRRLANFADEHDLAVGLAAFTSHNNLHKKLTIATAWLPPDWSSVATAWKPTMTARFHHCLKDWRRVDQNVAFNTLFVICCGRVNELTQCPIEKGPPRWQTSSLRKYDDRMQVVWVAKEIENEIAVEGQKGVVEAHFVGSRDKCLQFKQVSNIIILF